MPDFYIERIAVAAEKFANGIERLSASSERIADSLGKIKDILRDSIGSDEIDNIAGAIMSRPMAHSENDVFSHPLAVLDAMEEEEDEEEEE